MNAIPPTVLRRLVHAYDRLWRRLHRVRRIDALLSLSVEPYRGRPRSLPAGIHLEHGACLGILHFNHTSFADTGRSDAGNPRAALQFRRQLFRSLRQLAQRAQQEPALGRIEVFYGVTWFRPHGERVGFVVQRLPDGPRTRLRRLHFRILLRAFFPGLAERERGRLHPHAFWLTRQALVANFGGSPQGGITDRAATG